MSAPNLLSPTTVTGKVVGLALTGSYAAIVTAGASNCLNIRSLYVANIDVAAHAVRVQIVKASAGGTFRLAVNVQVPITGTVTVITSETPVTLEPGDALQLLADTTSALEAVCTYDDIS